MTGVCLAFIHRTGKGEAAESPAQRTLDFDRFLKGL
jgi:hypothetical protein